MAHDGGIADRGSYNMFTKMHRTRNTPIYYSLNDKDRLVAQKAQQLLFEHENGIKWMNNSTQC